MHFEPEFTADLSGFEGQLPLMPLDGVVLFPHVAIPLHIFEPRYKKMISDVLQSHRLLALALLRPERAHAGTPALHDVVCICRITAEEQLAGGRYNLVLTGLQRAQLQGELVTDLPYRIGELKPLPDSYDPSTTRERAERHRELLTSFRSLTRNKTTDSLFQQLLDAELPLGVLCDLLAAALKIPHASKYRALSEVDVDARSQFLLTTIAELSMDAGGLGQRRRFPPQFSIN